jgi:hypothetical protein
MKRLTIALVSLVVAFPVTAETKDDPWIVERKTSPVTSMQSIMLQTTSLPIAGPFGRQTHAALSLRCQPDQINRSRYTFEAFVHLGGNQVGSYGCIVYRIDKGTPQRECGIDKSTNFGAYFIRRSRQFAKSLVDKERLAMEIPTFSSGHITVEFVLNGLKPKLAELEKLCNTGNRAESPQPPPGTLWRSRRPAP